MKNEGSRANLLVGMRPFGFNDPPVKGLLDGDLRQKDSQRMNERLDI